MRRGPQRRVNSERYMISRLVMEKIIRRKLKSNEDVHHRDENPRNNSPNNLQLMTHGEHASFHRRRQLAGAKLLPSDIPTIRRMLVDGIRGFVVALAYGVSPATISRIKSGTIWGWMK